MFDFQMGIRRLVDIGNGDCEDVRLSHAVQRLMFWSEAGRNAFKDDGAFLLVNS